MTDQQKEKTPAAQTWDASSKDMINLAASWMLAECVRQGRKWNTLSDNDLIVAQGYDLVEADALKRGVPPDAVIVTHGELLDAMQKLAVSSKHPGTPAYSRPNTPGEIVPQTSPTDPPHVTQNTGMPNQTDTRNPTLTHPAPPPWTETPVTQHPSPAAGSAPATSTQPSVGHTPPEV